MAGVLAVDGHVDDRADAVAVVVLDAELRPSACCCPAATACAVDLGGDAVAADLLNIGNAAAVDLLAVGPLEALADGVRRRAFGQRRVFQQLLLVQRAVVNAGDLKHALGQRAGLVKDDALWPRTRASR